MARNQVTRIREANTAARILEEEDTIAREALKLRRAGHSFFAIAEKLQLPEARVAALSHRAIASAAALVSSATRTELLALELERLDALQLAVWDDAMDGDTRSVAEARNIIGDRIKYQDLNQQASTITAQTVIITGESQEYRDAMARFQNGTAGRKEIAE